MITVTKGNFEQFLAANRAVFMSSLDTEFNVGRAVLNNLTHDQLQAALIICDASARGTDGMKNTVISACDTYKVSFEGNAKDLAQALVQIGFATDIDVNSSLRAIIGDM